MLNSPPYITSIVLNMNDAIYPKYDAKRYKYFYWSESNFLRKGIDKERKVC